MNDMSLIQEFVQEAREYIDEIEPTLIEICTGSEESAGTVDAELINSVFRMFHSMKGSAGFLSLSTIAGVTHEAETLLNEIRNGKLSLSVQITATLCKAIDLFRAMLEHIEEIGTDDGFDAPAAAIIAVLKRHVAGEQVTENELAAMDAAAPPPDGEEDVPRAAAPAPAAAPQPREELSFEMLANEKPPEPQKASDLSFDEGTAAPPAPPAPAPEPEPMPVEPELAQLQLAPEMKQGFVTEATEQLESCEQSLLIVLDEKADHEEPIKDAFRYIHSFKGNCGFMGLVQLEHLSHTMETLLDKLRNNDIQPCEANVGTLLKKLDALRDGVRDIDNGGNGQVPNLNVHVNDLNVLLGLAPQAAPAAAPPPAPAAPAAPAAPLTGIDAEIAAALAEQAEAEKRQADAAAKGDMDGQIEAAFAARNAADRASDLQEKKAKGATASTPSAPAPAAAPKPAAVSAPAPVAAIPHPAVSVPAAAAGGQPPAGNAAAAAAAKKQDIRVDLHKLDVLINLVGELVIAESMVTRCPAVAHVEDEYYNRAKHQLRRICDDLQDVAMSVRMIPLSATFRKMIRLVHDLATKTGKKIKLDLLGEDTEVDKTVIEQIADPLVHIVRNSCDHGIEHPDERIQAGKTDTGSVILEGKHEGGEVWIVIKDDGHGLNRERIVAKAKEKGLVGDDVNAWSDDRVFKLIFEPGFSTADKVTDVSGRGVGMDVVKRNIEKLNGRIDIQSRLGQGATFTLRIPLTLAIVDAMLVRVGTGKYMIPTLTIRESLVPTKKQITITPEGREILRLREEMVPVVRLYDVFGCEPGATKLKDGILIVAEDGGRSFAFFVDEIIGQQQTVIKGLPEYLGDSNGFSGCTILGDGSVSLIVDVGAVSQMSGSFAASASDKEQYWVDTPGESSVNEEVSFADLESYVA